MVLCCVLKLMHVVHRVVCCLLQGTGEEVRLTVASADLSLSRGDAQQALATLKAVPSENQYYMTARHKMADIYLNHLHDKRMYAACYR